MSSKKKNIYLFLGKVILVTLLIVLFIRCFLIESFTVSSPQMETTLHESDRILIDKTAYGIRLPMTLLSIPFTFDNILGMKAYSTLIRMPYTRLFINQLCRNDVVLFNNPVEIDKPLDKRSLLISRCVALPGDSIQMLRNIFFINGKEYEASPNTMNRYSISIDDADYITDLMDRMNIPLREHHKISDTLFLRLNKYEASMLKESISDTICFACCNVDTTVNLRFLIPSKGKTITLDPYNILVYKEVIKQEQVGRGVVENNGILFIDNVKQDKYKFEDDYYWMLSDNSASNQDSRQLGFIPFKNVIGKVLAVWYNSDKSMRENRCFLPIK